MLQSNHLSLRSLQQAPSRTVSEVRLEKTRSQKQAASVKSLEALRDALPSNLSANKMAVINRLIDLHEQGAIG